MATKLDLGITYIVKLLDKNKWEQGEPTTCMSKGITWYTGGSKRATGKGAGINMAQPNDCVRGHKKPGPL